MKVGSVYLYRGHPVLITDGRYEVNGLISNAWSFRYVNEDGTLGCGGRDYNVAGNFTCIPDADVVTKVILPKELEGKVVYHSGEEDEDDDEGDLSWG